MLIRAVYLFKIIYFNAIVRLNADQAARICRPFFFFINAQKATPIPAQIFTENQRGRTAAEFQNTLGSKADQQLMEVPEFILSVWIFQTT